MGAGRQRWRGLAAVAGTALAGWLYGGAAGLGLQVLAGLGALLWAAGSLREALAVWPATRVPTERRRARPSSGASAARSGRAGPPASQPEGPHTTTARSRPGPSRTHTPLLQAVDRLQGVRPYQHGDAPHLIHWPAWARTRRLWVRTFDVPTAAPVPLGATGATAATTDLRTPAAVRAPAPAHAPAPAAARALASAAASATEPAVRPVRVDAAMLHDGFAALWLAALASPFVVRLLWGHGSAGTGTGALSADGPGIAWWVWIPLAVAVGGGWLIFREARTWGRTTWLWLLGIVLLAPLVAAMPSAGLPAAASSVAAALFVTLGALRLCGSMNERASVAGLPRHGATAAAAGLALAVALGPAALGWPAAGTAGAVPGWRVVGAWAGSHPVSVVARDATQPVVAAWVGLRDWVGLRGAAGSGAGDAGAGGAASGATAGALGAAGARPTAPLRIEVGTVPTPDDTVVARLANVAEPSYWKLASYRSFDGAGWSGRQAAAAASSLEMRHANAGLVPVVPPADQAALGAVPFAVASSDMAPYLQLPAGLSARVGELARNLTMSAHGPWQAAQALATYLREHETYRLVPASAVGHDVNQFLFASHEGFCDQFSTALVVMMRTLGVPARWVVGYGPGDYLAAAQTTVLRANDAHSWAEILVPGHGWVPVDPTPGSGLLGSDVEAGAGAAEGQGVSAVGTPSGTAGAPSGVQGSAGPEGSGEPTAGGTPVGGADGSNGSVASQSGPPVAWLRLLERGAAAALLLAGFMWLAAWLRTEWRHGPDERTWQALRRLAGDATRSAAAPVHLGTPRACLRPLPDEAARLAAPAARLLERAWYGGERIERASWVSVRAGLREAGRHVRATQRAERGRRLRLLPGDARHI